jgi:uncharacterized membrane protein
MTPPKAVRSSAAVWNHSYSRLICSRSLVRCLTLLFAVLLLCAPALARSWRITDFTASVAVGQDGRAVIHERITASFSGSFNGIYRTIPVEYPGPAGTNYTLYTKVLGVTDGEGQPLRYEKKRKGAYIELKIYVPGAQDATRTVDITYETPNSIRYFEDHDEFYWNVTGNDWPVPIESASAVVAFPPSAAGSLRAQAFTGVYGSHDQEATADVKGSNVYFATTAPLPMRGGLTIDIYIPRGILTRPGSLTRIGWFLRANSILFLPVVAFAVMFALWWYRGKDPAAGLSVAPMYEPPKGMTPAETGTLIDDSIDPRDITCTVVDLAVRGYLKIEQTEERHLIFSNKDYVFHLLKSRDQWTDLAPHERVVLEHMFEGGGDTCRMSSLKNRFYTAIPALKQDILAALKKKGMYSVDPNAAAGYVVGGAVLIGLPFILLQVTGVVDFFFSVTSAVIGIGLAALIVILFGRQMTAKSMLGQRTKIAVLGFQEFMNRVDADRLKRMPPDTFEKYLPYAMALGVEQRWAQAFKDIVREPPSWYVAPAGYSYAWNPIFFANSMHTMSADMHSVMVSAPRSSSTGSGFGGGGGGGGFSGGGFGGGGGGAF